MFSYPFFTISLWNVESWDLEYVILLKESNILLMIRIQNLSVSDRIQYLEPRIQSVEYRIQDFLGLLFIGPVVGGHFFFFNLNSIIDVLKNNVYHVPEL